MSGYYKSLEEYIGALDKSGKLFTVERPVQKETELTSLARLQYRGLPEKDRRGFLFEHVTDAKSHKYKMKVATGIYASSLEIYAMGLQCEPTREAIQERWQKAQLSPMKTVEVNNAPVQEVVMTGEKLLENGGGVESLPIPVELPGLSGQIRTSTQFISVDPDTGIQNVGNYSTHVFGKTKLLWEINRGNHGIIHWRAWKKLGKPMPAAVIVGGPPSYFYVGAAKLPYGVDELTVAGGFSGEPVKTVKGKTVDLQVPSDADIIIEGYVSTEYMEPGNAFGEYTGYMATDVWLRPVMEITAITTRKNPVFVHIMSQFPPSESSQVRRVSSENIYLKFLRNDARIPGILDVAWHEMSQAQWCVIKIKKLNKSHPWQVLNLAAAYDMRWGKFFIVVDEDIDIRNLDSVIWAMSWRVQPARDMKFVSGRMPGLDPSAYSPDASHEDKEFPGETGASGVLIDATTKFPYPPTSLPRKEYMEKAKKIWEELGFPKLNLVEPWYGYELGFWPDSFKRDAELILKGEHYKIGEELARRREKAE